LAKPINIIVVTLFDIINRRVGATSVVSTNRISWRTGFSAGTIIIDRPRCPTSPTIPIAATISAVARAISKLNASSCAYISAAAFSPRTTILCLNRTLAHGFFALIIATIATRAGRAFTFLNTVSIFTGFIVITALY